jgi:hypothetical protein
MKRVGLLFLLLALLSPPARAATVFYSLAIGYNGIPPEAGNSGIGELSFADDDALAVDALARTVTRRSIVLTLPDRGTQARYPRSNEARPPSLVELRRALAELSADIAATTRNGDDAAVWFYYSGHGWLDGAGRASLTLADGALSQDILYNEVLPALPGRPLHLMIDACHAEAMIRSRDVSAETVEVSAAEVASSSLRAQLGKLPHVGALMASTRSTQAHEWDEYQTGVFTHELLSGLRGAADVNRDGRVEYSEIAAFLAAANRGVSDPRGHLATLIVAPALYPRTAIMNTDAPNQAHVLGPSRHLGRLQIEDKRGNRLVDLRAEPGFAFDVVVPADDSILLSSDGGETTLATRAGHAIRLEEVVLGGTPLRTRSAVAEAMRRGLFSAAFGPSYYAGYVDNPASRMVPVDLSVPAIQSEAKSPSSRGHLAAWSTLAVGGASLAASVFFGIMAARAHTDFENADFERPSADARTRYNNYGAAAIGTAAVTALAGALGYWLWHRDEGR